MRIVDLICEDREVEFDVALGFEQAIPDCPACGGSRKVWWGGGKAPGVKVFKPVHHDGVGWITDEATLNATRAVIAREQNCSVDDIVINRESKQEIRMRADEVRHRRAERNRLKGLDGSRLSEIRNTARKHGINPQNNKAATKKLPKELK